MGEICFARTCDPSGQKATHDVKVWFTESMHDDIVMVARLSGKSKSEWIKALIEKELYGQLEAVRRKVNGNTLSSEGER